MFLPYFLCCYFIAATSARMAFRFASGFEELFGGEPDKTFSCQDRSYGYYADVQNDCKIFHICNPILNEDGEVSEVDHYSFICGNQTVFSQESLTCSHPEDAFPCSEAASLYELVNSEFGRVAEGRSDNQDAIDRIKASVPKPTASKAPVVQEVAEVAEEVAEEVADEVAEEAQSFGLEEVADSPIEKSLASPAKTPLAAAESTDEVVVHAKEST